jgi:quercetin dioxygenase-like cupin family protein
MARLAVDVSWESPPPISPQLVDQVDREHVPSKLEHNAILLLKAGLFITRSEALPWEPGAIPGVFSKSLYVDSEKKYSTVLVRMEPRAVYPAHKHNDIEEVFVLEGDLFVDGVRMVPGDYCRSEPGSIHAATTTESGALLLVSASQEDEIFV